MAPRIRRSSTISPVRNLDRRAAWVMVIAGAIALLAAIMLIVEKVSVLSDPNYSPGCDINPVLSCGSVINTEQASIFGFPNPIMGVIGFTVVITIGVLVLARVTVPRWIWIGLNLGAVFGMGFVIWLIYQSLYSIGALCPWCMVVWAAMVPIFWYITAANFADERLRAGAVGEVIVSLRLLLVGATYLVVVGLIFVRWADFWLGR
jgi:uncharacterized membrane protein